MSKDELNATPGAIDLARELGIDLVEVEGTGAEGKIYKADVERLRVPEMGPKAPLPKGKSEDVDLHTVVRVISKTGAMTPNASAFPVVQVDAYISSFLEQGYTLANTHYLGEIPEGFIMMYILLRR